MCQHESTQTVGNGITKRVVVEMVGIDLSPQSITVVGSYVGSRVHLRNGISIIKNCT